jgi:hypothetical protein
MNRPEGPEPEGPRHPSRVGKKLLSGHFEAPVVRALKTIALEQDTTVQSLLARAINDFLEKNGYGRPASETPLPRGGAAHLAPRLAAQSAPAAPAPGTGERRSRGRPRKQP